MRIDGLDTLAYFHLRVALAVLLRAALDARGAFEPLAEEAREWLAEEGTLYCQALELDAEAMLRWLSLGCPENHGCAEAPDAGDADDDWTLDMLLLLEMLREDG